MNTKLGAGGGVDHRVASDNPNGQIATKLKALYMAVQEEAIPDRFLDLLEQLDAVERRTARDVAK